MKRWYALYTKPHKERQVCTLLEGQSIEVFLPTAQRKIRRRDRPERVVFFPCYLFAHIDFRTVPQSSIEWMPGMRRIGHVRQANGMQILDSRGARLAGLVSPFAEGFREQGCAVTRHDVRCGYVIPLGAPVSSQESKEAAGSEEYDSSGGPAQHIRRRKADRDRSAGSRGAAVRVRCRCWGAHSGSYR